MSEYQYKNLTFNGGGVKIFSSVGTLKVLEQEGVLSDIENVSGASAGAVLALMVCLEMSADEIEKFFINDFDPAIEAKESNKETETKRFFEELGRYSGDGMRSQVEKVLEQQVGYKDITFIELHDLGYKNPYIAVTDITDKKSLIFSYEDTPNAKVIDAIHASAAYPLLFKPVILENGHILADGGIFNNYPIDVFDDLRFNDSKYHRNPYNEYNTQTLGIFLGCKNNGNYSSTKLEDIYKVFELFNDMDHELIKKYIDNLDVSYFDEHSDTEYNIYSYIRDISNIVMDAPNASHHETGEIFIPQVNGIKSMNIHISTEERLKLMSYGEKAAHDFFSDENQYNYAI